MIAHLPRRGGRGLGNLRLYVLRGLRLLRRCLLRLVVVVVLEDVCQSFFDFERMAPGGGPEKPYLRLSDVQ
ncbi:MAG: hypothetical protein ACO2PN_04425 [Pyrobaculum sp.]